MKRNSPQVIQTSFKLLVLVAVFWGISAIFQNLTATPSALEVALKSEIYADLPASAQELIAKTYEQTGAVLPLLENQTPGQPYVNTSYLEYLELSDEEKEKVEIVPTPTLVAFNPETELEIVVPNTLTAVLYDTATTNENLETLENQNAKNSTNKETSVIISETTTFPNKYDARDVAGMNLTSEIRNQGSLGICWAITAIETAETLARNQNLTTTNLSERQLDYVMAKNGIKDFDNPYPSFLKDRSVGSGGNFYLATIGLSQGISMSAQTNFANNYDTSPRELTDVLSFQNSSYELTGTINLPVFDYRLTGSQTTESEIQTKTKLNNLTKQYLLNYGSGYVNTYVDNSCLAETTNGELLIDHYHCGNGGRHAMQIIGWDDEIEYNYCADSISHNQTNLETCQEKVKGQGAWLLQNSWGEINLPYLYLAYDSFDSQIAFVTEISKTANKTWGNNYLVGEGTDFYDRVEIKLEDTEIKDTETLDSLKFITNAMGGNYLVTVYEKPGEVATSQNIHALMPGLVTVKLNANLTNASTIVISSESGKIVDRVGIFTKNQSLDPYLSLENFASEIGESGSFRLYSQTKNLASGTSVSFRLSASTGDSISIPTTFNQIASNNLNPILTLPNDLAPDYYTLEVFANDNLVASKDFKFKDPPDPPIIQDEPSADENPNEEPTENSNGNSEENLDKNPSQNPGVNSEENPDVPPDKNPSENLDDNPDDNQTDDPPANDNTTFKNDTPEKPPAANPPENPPPTTSPETFQTTYNINNSYIENVTNNTTLTQFKNHFELKGNQTLEVVPSAFQTTSQNLTRLDPDSLIGTGSKVQIYQNGNLIQEFENIVPGDLNGDGKISPVDLLRMKQFLLGSYNLEGVYFEAADVSGDNHTVSPADLLRIRQHLLNIKPIN